MVKNKDKWSALSMSDRADLIKLYVSNGITSLDTIKKDYNSFVSGGPKDDKHVEDVVRTTRGSTGRLLTKTFPFFDFKGAKHLWESWRVMHGSDKKVAPSDDNYTGTAMKGVGVQTDDGLGFASQQDLANALGYTPKDFVDTYVYGDTPFEELGVFKKEDSPERHVIRSKVKKVEDSGKQLNTYQTQRDTLDTNTVAALDSLLNAGLVDLHSENTTYQESPFNIGDSGIIYDGNNSTIATAYLPNGMPVSKAIDVFDTDPKEWNYKVSPLAKTGLSFMHNNTNPFLMTTPWYYPIKSTDFLSRLYYLFGIEADPEYNVISNKGDKNGVIWDLHEALEWLDSHPNLAEMPVKTNKFEEGGNKSSINQILFSPENPYMWEGFNAVEEPTLTLPVHNWRESKVLSLPQKEVEKAYGFHRNVMVPEEMPTTEELQKMLDNEVIFAGFNEDINNWKVNLAEDDLTSLYKLIGRESERFNSKMDKLYNYDDYRFDDFDENDVVKITAPNTDISKFIFGNKVSNKALAEVARVSKLRGQDPYDVLAHMLIEASGSEIDMNQYYNTHDLFTKQVNPNLLGIYYEEEQLLKQLGIYNKDRKPTIKQVQKAFEKLQAKREEALSKIVIPESNIDAVALRMMLHGRDFNPAQKGFVPWLANNPVKNSYLDMIDSAIVSLKENMPDLFK